MSCVIEQKLERGRSHVGLKSELNLRAVEVRKELEEGDLIFFDTSKEKKGYITHVGIYLGDNNFIHASSANKEVVISSLNQSFYKARFKWGRRVNKLLASK